MLGGKGRGSKNTSLAPVGREKEGVASIKTVEGITVAEEGKGHHRSENGKELF